jgi:hypothetical protein
MTIHNHLENDMFVNFKTAARLAGTGVVSATLAALPAVAQTTATPQAQPKAATAIGTNMMVIRDAATGLLRAPTAEEAAALQQIPSAAKFGRSADSLGAPSSPATPMSKAHSSGARGARLTDEMATYSVAVRRADGTLEIEHVDGKAAATAAVKAAKVAPAVPTVPTE